MDEEDNFPFYLHLFLFPSDDSHIKLIKNQIKNYFDCIIVIIDAVALPQSIVHWVSVYALIMTL